MAPLARLSARSVTLMGILNITPDSFSDGGKFVEKNAAVERALKMVDEGAKIIDIGAESTRPGSAGVEPAVQLKRILPVLVAFRKHSRARVSIDTRSALVAGECLAAGANIINDVSALRHDPAMPGLISQTRSEVILMHMLGDPATMQRAPRYKNVVSDIINFFRARLAECGRAGIRANKIRLDPGIGFGKTLQHNLRIIRELNSFREELGHELVVGVSRKSFLGKLTNEPDPGKRVTASVVAGLISVTNGASILRVHDVAEHAAALRVLRSIS